MMMPIEELIYKLDETQEFEVNSNQMHIVRVPIYRYYSADTPLDEIEDIMTTKK